MKKLSKTKKAVLMLTMLLSLTTAFAGDGTNGISDFARKFWGGKTHDMPDGTTMHCDYRFWIETNCFPV